MPRIILVLTFLIASVHPLFAQAYREVPDLVKCFEAQSVTGTSVPKRIPIGREFLKALGKLTN